MNAKITTSTTTKRSMAVRSGYHPVDGGDLSPLVAAGNIAKSNYVGMFGYTHDVDDEPADGDGLFFETARSLSSTSLTELQRRFCSVNGIHD